MCVHVRDPETDKVLPEGRVGLGNLVCVNGWLISQDLHGGLGFRQASLETLSEALKKDPADVPALQVRDGCGLVTGRLVVADDLEAAVESWDVERHGNHRTSGV